MINNNTRCHKATSQLASRESLNKVGQHFLAGGTLGSEDSHSFSRECLPWMEGSFVGDGNVLELGRGDSIVHI